MDLWKFHDSKQLRFHQGLEAFMKMSHTWFFDQAAKELFRLADLVQAKILQ